MQLTRNFKLSEFDCKSGCEMPESVLMEVKKLANQLQIIRDFIQQPIYINSGYRCKEHNAKIGGVKNSKHILGQAADMRVDNVSPEDLYEAIENLIKFNHIFEGGLGVYQTFVHYDIKLTRSRWDNR
tara:strand:- start:3863 stop:4243 length:381 start_codon:yes stop_codon:yes gene_type:complete